MILKMTASLSSKKSRGSHRIEKTPRLTKQNQHYTIQEFSAGVESWFGSGCACLMGVLRNSFPCTLSLNFFGLGKNGTLQ